MDEGLMTKERLASYVSLRLEVENQLERLARMKNDEKIPAIRSGDESKRTGTAGGRMERAIIRRMEDEERVLPQIEAAQEEMEAIESAISALPDPMEREVLRLRYIDGEYYRLMPWKDVSLRLFGGDDDKHILATFRLHGKALQTLICISNSDDQFHDNR